MSSKIRDYRAEYVRRIERAAARGLSRSQGRGHARSGEAAIKRSGTTKSDASLEDALRTLRKSGSQKEAARSANVSPERFRRFLREQGLARREGRTWTFTDDRFRETLVLTDAGRKHLTVKGFEQASLAGQHLAAVKRFIDTNDISPLTPFIGKGVTDTNGRFHRFETDPNRLYRFQLFGSGDGHVPEIYRIVP